MDNLPAHQSPRIDRLIEPTGARVLRLPPYSPDFNPIEMAFSKIKQLLRSLATRTTTTLWSSMQGVLDHITTSDAAGYFRPCGYAAAIVSLAHAIGLEVVAEGVATPGQLELLRSMGCEQAQGFLFARPSCVEETESPLAADPSW